MTYDQDLAQRVHIALASAPDVDTRLMFGGIAFMVGGHMACGVIGQDLMGTTQGWDDGGLAPAGNAVSGARL